MPTLWFNGRNMILLFAFSLALYPTLAPQTSESAATSYWTISSSPTPDFTIGSTLPSVVPADGSTPATSTIVVNPISDFTGTVTLSDVPLPANVVCTAIAPAAIPNALGIATLSCTSSVAGTYTVTITGTSGGISHNSTRTFTFAAFASPDFTIATVNAVSFSSSSSATSNVTVTPQGGFHSQVNLTAAIYPNIGLSVSLKPQYLDSGSGLATATFNSSSPGDYIVTIAGTSKSLSHTVMVVVAVTLVGIPDFRISTSSSSINIEAGNPGATRIVIVPNNGIADSVSLVVTAPASVSCNLSPPTIESSGTSTLTCNGNTPGDYLVTITATGASGSHTTTVNLHVAAVAPVAPVPATFLGLTPIVFYGIIAGIIAVVVTGTFVALRSRRSSAHPV